MRRIVAVVLVPVLFLCTGCMTVRLDSEFVEKSEGYRADGSLESVVETRWTQTAKGGPFTDIEQMKQDTSYVYEGPQGERYEIGQGSGVNGVSASGQVVALGAALQALSTALNLLGAGYGLAPAPTPAPTP